MSPQQQLAYARQQAQAALLPSVQANQRAQQQAAEQARNQAAAGQAAYAALAKLQGGIAPAIGDTYSAAADRQAAYGKGFSNTVGAALDSSAANANSLLAANGSPQRIASQGGSAKDILYALGGYSPASVLNAQGAAFESAARNLPAQSVGLGVDAAKAARNAGQATSRDLLSKLVDLQAQRPGLVQQALQQTQSNQRALYGDAQTAQARNQQLALEAAAYGLNVDKFKLQQANSQSQRAGSWRAIASGGGTYVLVNSKTGAQKVTDIPVKKNAAGKTASLQMKNVGGKVAYFNPKTGKLVQTKLPYGSSKKSAGSSPYDPSFPHLNQAGVQHLQSGVANAYKGINPKTGQPDKDYPAATYQEAIQDMVQGGYSRAAATRMANRFYVHPWQRKGGWKFGMPGPAGG